jgi:hypothetical protein
MQQENKNVASLLYELLKNVTSIGFRFMIIIPLRCNLCADGCILPKVIMNSPIKLLLLLMIYNIKKSFRVKYLSSCLLLFLCLVFTNTLLAQQTQEDVVYLKNGSIIHGTIIENVIGVSIKIQTADRSIWVFKMDEIEKITKEDKPASSTSIPDEKSQNLSNTKGYYNVSTAGLILVDYDIAGTATMVNGYKWSPFFSTGAMISFDAYGENLYAPLGLDVRGEILRAPVTPYWYAQAGFPIISPANTEWETYKPGMMYQTGAGVLFMVSKTLGLVAEAGYKVQRLHYESSGWGGSTKQDIKMRNIAFKVGLQF